MVKVELDGKKKSYNAEDLRRLVNAQSGTGMVDPSLSWTHTVMDQRRQV